MGKIISVYTQEAFKEYIMPALNNSDYTLVLNKKHFQLAKDIQIRLEIIDDIWRIKPDEQYRVFVSGVEVSKVLALDREMMLTLLVEHGRKIVLATRNVENPFTSYVKYDIRRLDSITIGKDSSNMIRFDYRNRISRNHAEISFRGNRAMIINRSRNGLYVNSGYVADSAPLAFGDYINILGLHMVFLERYLAIDTNLPDFHINDSRLIPVEFIGDNIDASEAADSGETKILYHRSPRSIEKIETEPVEIEEPPGQQKTEQRPLLTTIGPSFTMAIPMLLGSVLMISSSRRSGGGVGLFMYSGMVMAISSALIGVTWAIVNLRTQKKLDIEKENRRFEAYSQYLIKKTDEIRSKYTHNQNALASMYPPVSECLTYDDKSRYLWNRNASHEDFLCCRLGTGDMDFQVPIEIPKSKFTLEVDQLADKPAFIEENYKILKNVPILIDLMKHRFIGIVGGAEKKGAYDIAYILAGQLAACTCYTDVKMVFIYDGNSSEDAGQWEFARWLPHVWAEDKKTRYIASDKNEAGEVFYELTKILRQREEDTQGQDKKKIPKPWFVLFLSDPELIKEELIAKYITDDQNNVGLTTIMLAERREFLPNSCEFIIEKDELFNGFYDISARREEEKNIQFDDIDPERLDSFARKLSNIEIQETETGGEIPASLTFFEMYGISRPEELKAEERWLKNRTYDNIKGLIGQKSGGLPCYLDVHEKYHGPHGLVAGTTGSGKSETLQTYMLSLAINYSPDDIGFFIIDYKGGGMANLFDGLPHMIGQISNLSGNQVRRAMVSIKSENRRRQRIFNDSGVNNINNYTRLYKSKEATIPIPHLFIIIDEFAELKREEPEFMKELISVAQVGRSLGVHLILATQKPSGTVDDNIWSNSKFRLCLRVQDRQDSNDMLHKPDAAYITQAGRAYLQVGNDEVYEMFQSGWSGAPYDENLDNGRTDIARLLSLTGKTEITGVHERTARKERMTHRWVSQLVECLRKCGFAEQSDRQPALQNRSEMLHLLERFYISIEEAGLDYPRNRYNDGRLEEFINLTGMAAELPGDIAANIIKIAADQNIKLPQAREKTQLDAVKEYLRKVAEKNAYTNNHQLWMPILPDHLYLQSFTEYHNNSFKDGRWPEYEGAWSMDVPAGMIDDPQNQAQTLLHVSFSEGGHHAVIGAVVTGKSTLMQTILYGLITKYSPEYLNIYGIDFSSKMMAAFEKDAHFGGVMYEGDNDRIAKFFNMMGQILEERKKVFRGGNYSQYVQVHGMEYPAIIIAIDNYSAFMEKTGDEYENMIIQLSKEGVGHGIFLLLSAGGFGMNEIPNRIAQNIKTVLCLEMADKYAYTDVLHSTRIDVLPETGIKGRGLAVYGNRILEYQAALAVEAEDDYKRMEKIAGDCHKMSSAWKGKTARTIPEIPEKPDWELFASNQEAINAFESDNLLPVGYNTANAQVYSIDLRDIYCYLIAGAARTGKKNFMRIMIESAKKKNSSICIVDGTSVMDAYKDCDGVSYVTDEETLFRYFNESLTPVFKERNIRKNQLLADGCYEEELFDFMKDFPPVFIFITDMMWFMDTVYSSVRGMKGFMETLTKKGRYHNIYFIGILDLENKNTVRGYQAFNNFSAYKTGAHFGGNVSQNPFMNFDYLSFTEQTKTQKPGIAQLPESEDGSTVRYVVVPMAGRRKKER